MMTAATAAIAVIPNPSNGLCPRLTAKEVITPAPNPAIINEPTQSLLELWYIDDAFGRFPLPVVLIKRVYAITLCH